MAGDGGQADLFFCEAAKDCGVRCRPITTKQLSVLHQSCSTIKKLLKDTLLHLFSTFNNKNYNAI